MSNSKYYNYYTHAGRIAKLAEWMMYASAVIFLLNAFSTTVRSWQYWHNVLNLNTFLLIVINMALIAVSWLNFAARGNKLAGCIDNAYDTTLAQEPANPKYYDNNNVLNSDLKFALNVYESCFFSDAILRKQTLQIIIKNMLIATLFFMAIVLEYSHVAMTILGLFVVIHFLRKLFVFLVVKNSLSEICGAYQSIFNNYKKNGILDMQAVTLSMSNYETAMVWLGTVLSGKIYKKFNNELTKEWLEKQKGFLRGGDSQG
jgi:hypothetical protein